MTKSIPKSILNLYDNRTTSPDYGIRTITPPPSGAACQKEERFAHHFYSHLIIF